MVTWPGRAVSVSGFPNSIAYLIKQYLAYLIKKKGKKSLLGPRSRFTSILFLLSPSQQNVLRKFFVAPFLLSHFPFSSQPIPVDFPLHLSETTLPRWWVTYLQVAKLDDHFPIWFSAAFDPADHSLLTTPSTLVWFSSGFSGCSLRSPLMAPSRPLEN